jgi:uncharacterized Zn finger protein
MSEIRSPTLTSRDTTRPRCPQCQALTTIQHATPARAGYEHWTLRCSKCGHIHEAQVPVDPLKSDAIGWANSNLNPPT